MIFYSKNLALKINVGIQKLIEHIVEFESCQSSLSLPLMDGFLALFTHEIVLKIFPWDSKFNFNLALDLLKNL